MLESPIGTAVIAGAVSIVVALAAFLANVLVASAETGRRRWEYQMKRRSERQEAYLLAIDVLTEWQWRDGDPDFDVKKDFTLKFVRAASRVRIYGSPASIAALDEIQTGLAMRNRANSKKKVEEAEEAIGIGLDHMFIAASADVGPHSEDNLGKKVAIANAPREGAGPRA
jgi:hypothetical protein